MSERSSESGQDYAAVESIEAVGFQFPLLRKLVLQSPTATGIGPFSRGGLIATRGCSTVDVCMPAVFCRLSLRIRL